jgi:hypothetical protein
MYFRRATIGKLMALAIVSAAASPAMAQGEPSMGSVVSDFVTASIRLQSIDMAGDPERYRAAAEDRTDALTVLAFHRPADLTELANKLAALVEFTEDTERFALRMVVEDALVLNGGAK